MKEPHDDYQTLQEQRSRRLENAVVHFEDSKSGIADHKHQLSAASTYCVVEVHYAVAMCFYPL